MKRKICGLVFTALALTAIARAQTAEVSVALNEQFFDALLDAIFKNFDAPEFPLAQKDSRFQKSDSEFQIADSEFEGGKEWFVFQETSFNRQNGNRTAIQNLESAISNSKPAECRETIRLLRERDGVRTAVRFRDGKIYAPIAFAGSYNPPFVGCVDFQGVAETNIELEYNRRSQKLTGRVRVLSVNLGGAANLASGVLSRLVQSSIDKKINPVEILQTDKLSFLVPLQNQNGSLKMKAVGVSHQIENGVLNVTIAYEFSKGE